MPTVWIQLDNKTCETVLEAARIIAEGLAAGVARGNETPHDLYTAAEPKPDNETTNANRTK